MINFFLVQSEKAYNAQSQNVFTLGVFEAREKVNKVKIAQVIKSLKLDPLKIRVVNPGLKTKRRGKKFKLVVQKRAKKLYITLQKGQKIDDDFLQKINNHLNPSLESK